MKARVGPVEFGVFTNNGTAIANGDYTSSSQDGLVIPAGQTLRALQFQVRGETVVVQVFADRLAEFGIGVFEIRPGIIKTDMTKVVTEKYDKLIEDLTDHPDVQEIFDNVSEA